jgi:hypothetical protein
MNLKRKDKQFDKLLNYNNFDLSNYVKLHNRKNYFIELLKNCKDEKVLKYVIDNAINLECNDDIKKIFEEYMINKKNKWSKKKNEQTSPTSPISPTSTKKIKKTNKNKRKN